MGVKVLETSPLLRRTPGPAPAAPLPLPEKDGVDEAASPVYRVLLLLLLPLPPPPSSPPPLRSPFSPSPSPPPLVPLLLLLEKRGILDGRVEAVCSDPDAPRPRLCPPSAAVCAPYTDEAEEEEEEEEEEEDVPAE